MALVQFPGTQSGAYATSPEEDDESAGASMSFLEHLDELRKRIINACLAIAVGVLGAAFNHYIAFPYMMIFFASFNTPTLAFMPKLDDVFGLYTKMLIGMGIVFQMPTVVFFLAKMKVVTARFLARNFKYAVLIIF